MGRGLLRKIDKQPWAIDVSSAQRPARPGYLLAAGIEATGRVLAQVDAGEPDSGLLDGDRVFVDNTPIDAA